MYLVRRLRKAITGVIVCGLVLFVLTGCDKVTRENYKKLQVGMEYGAVTKVLGKPTECRALLQAKSCTWGQEPRVISIQFIGEKVGVFSSRGL